ncbi:MAG: 3-mercaptopyruvate sulfurtransferase [Ilumatobacteraceae bacterium]|nr:3-mercaptopyruvate sulfurtransferase [Ilumatobacteraceae bacterium]MCU1386667.1 3-mercaptopyruvate sulfurtransferase [Ilumatobacteraceae bacterium]
MTTMPPIVSIDDLADHPDAVIADVRWYLDGRDARAAYESGHLPGAVFVDLEHDLSTPLKSPDAGRHPFPEPDAFAAAMGSLGIGDDSTVIAYDDTGGMTAGRLVVMLRMIGRNAAVLDGGIGLWQGELMQGPGVIPEHLDFTPCEWPLDRLADAEEVIAVASSEHGLVLDARAHARFTGEVTQIDPRPGHVPGASSAPWADNIDPETQRFRPAAELRERFNALGVSASDSVITYCGSGVSACMNILAMEQAGLPPARLYVASFSGWSADPDREVELGPGR